MGRCMGVCMTTSIFWYRMCITVVLLRPSVVLVVTALLFLSFCIFVVFVFLCVFSLPVCSVG